MLGLIFSDIKNNLRHSLLTVLMLMNYRIGHKLISLKLQWKYTIFLIPYILVKLSYKLLWHQLGCSIPFCAKVGCNLTFMHGLYGVFISGRAEVGNGCVILHQVTIGSNQGSASKLSAPKIGDDVFIGVGAKVIGNVIIGNGVKIGANALVCKNISPLSVCYAPLAIVSNVICK